MHYPDEDFYQRAPGDITMKKRKALFAGILMGLLGLVMLPGQAAALGTAAGTIISNYATGTYTDANSNTYAPVVTASVTTMVSQVGGISLTPLTASQSGAANLATYYPFSITNSGNGADSYNLVYSLSVDGGGASGWTVNLYVDQNGDGILDSNDQVGGVYVAVTSPVALAADATRYVIAVVTPVGTATNNQIGVLSGTATSVFAPAQTLSGTFTTKISGAVLTLSKTTVPVNPQPGETVTYTITYSNVGTAPGFNVVINDLVPSGVTYVDESIKLGGVAKTDLAADLDGAEEVVAGLNTTIRVSLASIAAGGSGSMSFQATVNSGVAEATAIVNSATITYNTTNNDNGTSVTSNSNPSTLTVSQLAGVLVAPATLSTNQLPGDLNVHPFTVKNTGNGADTYTFTSLGLYWTWTIYHDVNNDGKFDAGDTLVVGNNTGEILAGATGYYVATTTVTGTNGQVGSHTLTATSGADNTVKGTSIKSTNIQTPVMVMTKTVLPAGPQQPGTELTYTISVTNSGAAPAAAFFVSDILSTYLEYTAPSITVAGVAQTDEDDADFGHYDSGSHSVFISIPNISAGASLAIVFKATIK